jgi:hypothetical protein
MVTEHSHLTNEELVGVAFSLVSADDTLAFELLMRLEAAIEAYPALRNTVMIETVNQEEPA